MPLREFIHSTADVQEAMSIAADLELLIIPDVRRDIQAATPLTEDQQRAVTSGVFHLFRRAWVHGDIPVMRIEGTDSMPQRFVVKARTNLSPITLDFQGERKGEKGAVRRLGGGSISYKPEWQVDKTFELRSTPEEVGEVYKAFCARMLTSRKIRADRHTFYVCKHAGQYVGHADTLPPFDFIPWESQ